LVKYLILRGVYAPLFIYMYRKISDLKNNSVENLHFPKGVKRIIKYSFEVQCIQDKVRKYIAEIHEYEGTAMFKYYPRGLKNNPKRYELRGKTQLGYKLKVESFNLLILICCEIMKEFMQQHPHHYIGYIGQVDYKDNKNRRRNSQRYVVYNRFLNSIFKSDEYKFIQKNALIEINMRLIRKHINKNHTQTEEQKRNFNHFFVLLKGNADDLFNFMTERTKQEIVR
jgi:hypothetical protein